MGTTNTTETHADTITELTVKRDQRLATVRKLAHMLCDLSDIHPLEARIESDLCDAMDKHADAENALRLAESGYEETYPHPVGGVHPTDAYSGALRGR